MTKTRKAIIALFKLERIDKEGSTAVIDYLEPDAKYIMKAALDNKCIRCKHAMEKHYYYGEGLDELNSGCRWRRCKCTQYAEDNLEYIDQEAAAKGL